jgi:excisionase family DNA binding protein
MTMITVANIIKGTHARLDDGACRRIKGWASGSETPKRTPPTRAPDLLTAQQVAERWQVSVKHVRKMVTEGKLPYIDIGLGSKHRSIRFKLTDLERIEQSTQRHTPQSTLTNSKPPRHKGGGGEVIGFTARRLLKKRN